VDLETSRKILDHALNIKCKNGGNNEIDCQLDQLLSYKYLTSYLRCLV